MAFVEYRSAGPRTTWCISRPERGNAIGTTVASELHAALTRLEREEPLPRLLVITATPLVRGTRRTWIAGGDLKELAALAKPAGAAYGAGMAEFIARLDALPLPVIIAVDGAAIGGGAELALAGDLRLATQASHFEFRQLKLGLATGYGTARRLVQLIGLARAQSWLYTSAQVSADEASGAGLVHEVCADDAGLNAAIQRLERAFTAIDPAAFAAQKRMLHQALYGTVAASKNTEATVFAELWGNPTHAAHLAGFRRER